jgi:hypothetical protein
MLYYIPILGRLSLQAYTRLFIAFLVLLLEPILRFVFFVFPPLKWLLESVRTRIYKFYKLDDVSSPHFKTTEEKEASLHLETMVKDLSTTEDFIRYREFPFQVKHH